MAFLDLAVGAPVPSREAEARAATARLGSSERRVVLLSRADPLSSVAPRGCLARLAARLFGLSAPARLADARLEALRRYAIRYRLADALAPVEAEAAERAGLSPAELAQARALLDRAPLPPHRSGAARLARQLGSTLLLAVLWVAAAVAIFRFFDSRAVAVILSGLGLVSLVSLFAERSGGR